MIKTRSELKEYLSADHKAFGFRHPFLSRFSWSEKGTMFGYVRNLRYLEFYTNIKQTPIVKLLKLYHFAKWRRMNLKYHIYIKPNCVGPGLSIVHHGFRRIDSVGTIGKNLTILPLVLIGKKHPGVKIDNCSIGLVHDKN